MSAVGRESSEDDGKRANSREKKTLKHQPTLGGRLRAGIGQVSGAQAVDRRADGVYLRTSLHSLLHQAERRLAAFGYEQPRVLKQLQYSGILDMVRIRRQGFPSRLPFAEFEARFGALLLGAPKGSKKDGGGMMGTMKRAVTRAAAYTDDDQAEEAAAKARKLGYGGCLQILQRANLFEHRHYQFGKTLLFLRNGVEGALLKAVASQMLAVTWFQKTARGRKAVAHFAAAKRAALILQKHGRRRVAYREMRKRRAVIRRRLHALRMGAYGAIIAKTLEKRVAGWIEPRRAAKIQCQRLARGHLARKKVAWLKKLANRAAPLNRLRWAFRVYMCFLPGLRYLMARAMAIRVQREARRIKATQEVTKRKEAIPKMQALSRRRAANRHVGALRKMVLRLQTYAKKRADAGRAEAELLTQTNGAFNAAFLDDTDALASLTDALPELLLVRQNRHGQRASLAHALAAGGSVRAAPQLFLAMFGRAVAAGRATAPTFDADDGADVRTEAELHAAATYCAALRDADGRTPLHYAARWGELGFRSGSRRCSRCAPPPKRSRCSRRRRRPTRWSPPAAPTPRCAAASSPPCCRAASSPACGRNAWSCSGRRRCGCTRCPPAPPTRRRRRRRRRRREAVALAHVRQAAVPPLDGACQARLHRGGDHEAAEGKLTARRLRDPGLRRRPRDLPDRYGEHRRRRGARLDGGAPLAALPPRPRGCTSSPTCRAAVRPPRSSTCGAAGRWWNRRDGRGEALLHQALRGVVAGEEAERGRLVGWLCDQGAMLFDGADPIDDDDGDGKKKKGVLGLLGKSMRKMSLTPRADGRRSPRGTAAPAFELLFQLASREGGDAKIDAAWASLLKLIVKQAAAMMSAADLEGALAAARERWKRRRSPTRPRRSRRSSTAARRSRAPPPSRSHRRRRRAPRRRTARSCC